MLHRKNKKLLNKQIPNEKKDKEDLANDIRDAMDFTADTPIETPAETPDDSPAFTPRREESGENFNDTSRRLAEKVSRAWRRRGQSFARRIPGHVHSPHRP